MVGARAADPVVPTRDGPTGSFHVLGVEVQRYPVNRVSLHFSGNATPEKCSNCLYAVTDVTPVACVALDRTQVIRQDLK
ncbi:hypothetical protein BJ988_004364 [Nocardioides panzhihuensis]|uniref:Uncharacterized protein n=1 Tax=Nocardioides panzhihuensis TaxID=860243 RepID=A0A7Z0IU73_9ACTN|nr:hypothetical protein [Nocardioides panzhihuensis]